MSATASDSVTYLPLLKVVLLNTTGLSIDQSLSPPEDCNDRRTLFQRAIRHPDAAFCSVFIWSAVAADALVTVHHWRPTPLTAPLFAALAPFSPLYPAPLIGVTAALWAGAALTLLGAYIRLACLRPLFSEHSTSPTHRLVTVGAYACVRHPAYSGVFATLLGASAVIFSASGWFSACWLVPVFAGALGGAGWGTRAAAGLVCALAAFWCVKVAYALRCAVRQMDAEDEELHRVFGADWEAWAGRVPWKLIPWMY